MMRNEAFHLRSGRFAFALTVSFLACAGGALAQNPSSTLPPARMPSMTGDSSAAPQATAAPKALDETVRFSDLGVAPTAYHRKLGNTICESLFGDASAEGKWRPLTLDISSATAG